ncbi:MAG: inosine-5-monophosphate dehydrogenase, partial [Betaproteobacteria bacterium]|nr:inosine-5-monophosphate dehydrogenase [Betaproteobacteria bacterium]
RIRHLPVLEKGQLIGVISIGDVVRQMIIEQRQLIDQLEAYIRG